MSDLDGFDELETNMASDHAGSARKARAGRKFAIRTIQRIPLWKRQLGCERQRAPITLAGKDSDK